MGYLWTFSALPTIVGRMGWIIMGNFGCFLHTSDNCGANGVLLGAVFSSGILWVNSWLPTIVGDNGGLFGGFLRHFCGQNANGGRWGIMCVIFSKMQMGYTGVAKMGDICIVFE